jgi:hypothetical protein
MFISSFHNDGAEVDAFIYRRAAIGNVFTPKACRIFDNDDSAYGTNPEGILVAARIRETHHSGAPNALKIGY